MDTNHLRGNPDTELTRQRFSNNCLKCAQGTKGKPRPRTKGSQEN